MSYYKQKAQAKYAWDEISFAVPPKLTLSAHFRTCQTRSVFLRVRLPSVATDLSAFDRPPESIRLAFPYRFPPTAALCEFPSRVLFSFIGLYVNYSTQNFVCQEEKSKKEAHAPLFCVPLLLFPNEKADASHIESVTENVNPYCAKYTPP